jgi:1,4-alpha-glucan branching enzyme
MIFQGQPLLEDKWFSDTDPIDWNRLEKFNGYAMLHKDIIHLRRNNSNQTRGLLGQGVQIIRKDQEKKVIVLHRWQDGGPLDSVLIVFNFSGNHIENYNFGVPREGHWVMRLNSDSQLYDPHFANAGSSNIDTHVEDNDGFPISVSVDIPAYTALVFSQDS